MSDTDSVASATATEFRCSHNHWDNIRVKKGVVTLACRYCKGKWKLRHPIPNKCPDFYKGFCPFGAHCPYLHIHRFKSKLKSPDPTNYDPRIFRDDEFAEVARGVFEKHGTHISPATVYEEVIISYAMHQQRKGGVGEISPTEGGATATSVYPNMAGGVGAGTNGGDGYANTQGNAGGYVQGAAGDDDFGLTVEIPAAGQPLNQGGLRFGTPASAGHFAETPDTPITRRFVPQMRELDRTPPSHQPEAPEQNASAAFHHMKGMSANSPGVPPDIWRYTAGLTPNAVPSVTP